jgi:hypothetical protein
MSHLPMPRRVTSRSLLVIIIRLIVHSLIVASARRRRHAFATRSTLDHAIEAYHAGQFPSIRACAKAYSLQESTLRRRVQNRTTSRTEAAADKRSLFPWQEELLTTWILNSEQCGHGVTYSQLRDFVSLLNKNTGGCIIFWFSRVERPFVSWGRLWSIGTPTAQSNFLAFCSSLLHG